MGPAAVRRPSREVAARLGVCPVDLDRVAFDRSEHPVAVLGAIVVAQRATQEQRPLPSTRISRNRPGCRRASMSAGRRHSWLRPTLSSGSIPPTLVALWRIVARHAKASWHGTNEFTGLRLLARFLRSSLHYYRGSSDVPEELMTREEGTITEGRRRKYCDAPVPECGTAEPRATVAACSVRSHPGVRRPTVNLR